MKKAIITNKTRLSDKNSLKNVYHIELKTDIEYRVGDVLKIKPKNMPILTSSMLSLYGQDFNDYDLRIPSVKLLDVLSNREDSLKYLNSPLKFRERNDFIFNNTVPELIKKYGKIEEAELKSLLNEIRPRSYSISSSPKVDNEIHLTIALNKFTTTKGDEKGTSSSFIIENLEIGETVEVIHKPNNKFWLPENDVPIIMIATGTGIAPFIGFLKERKGENWLFFGEQYSYDFFYKSFILSQPLKLNTAFSKENGNYVQDELIKELHILLKWINNGAHIYICGNKEMGKAILETITKAAPEEAAILKEQDRIKIDVY